MGCLPACLFRAATEKEQAPGTRVQRLLCKPVFNTVEAHCTSYSDKVPKDFTWDQKPLVVEVIQRGEIADMLTAVESTEWLANLIAQANDVFQHATTTLPIAWFASQKNTNAGGRSPLSLTE